MPFELIPATLLAADLFAFASTSETQGLVTLEAMAAALPIVAVDAIGTRDVVDHEEDGFLTIDDPESMAKSISHLLDNKDIFEHFKDAAQKKSQSLEFTLQAKKLAAVYESVIQDKNKKA